MHKPRLLDAVEDLLGPDVLLWNSFLPFKAPRSSSHFGWHQDATYWRLDPPTLGLTVWLALGAVTAESGCMRVIPGSQTRGQLPHEQTFHKDSLLRRGQRIKASIEEDRAAEVHLEAGEMSLHFTRIVHGSGSNASDNWRLVLSSGIIDPIGSLDPFPRQAAVRRRCRRIVECRQRTEGVGQATLRAALRGPWSSPTHPPPRKA